jgi:SAM-dependent methyltransferase
MEYVGTELGVFEQAHNWKSYVRSKISKYISGNVLEVGAGLGAFTEALSDCAAQWCCLEPDAHLISSIAARQAAGRVSASAKIVTGTLADLDRSLSFDAILYMDVLEHIQDDVDEAREAAGRLSPGGRLIILAPAFQSVYSPFDAAIGHYRRYTRASLERIRPAQLSAEDAFYLDAPGLALSLVNRWLLRSKNPTDAQISFWDRRVIPIARRVDPLVRFRFGRSVVAIWRRS